MNAFFFNFLPGAGLIYLCQCLVFSEYQNNFRSHQPINFKFCTPLNYGKMRADCKWSPSENAQVVFRRINGVHGFNDGTIEVIIYTDSS